MRFIVFFGEYRTTEQELVNVPGSFTRKKEYIFQLC